MKTSCPYCIPIDKFKSEHRTKNLLIIRHGSYYRASDRKKVQRYYCKPCDRHFSVATKSINYRQKKRHINHSVARLLVAGVSLREGARILNINYKTMCRKFVFMGNRAKMDLASYNQNMPKAFQVQFDDMETFEHTKCKPVSITLAVNESTRQILGYEVSQMAAKGRLVKIALKKYGYRKDMRRVGRVKLMQTLQELVSQRAEIKSDENPHYRSEVIKYFPRAEYKQYKGKRGCIVGQGELKKIGFDPLFSLNHTCAMLRSKMNRLFRRTWCTTKKLDRLDLHLALAALHHNKELSQSSTA